MTTIGSYFAPAQKVSAKGAVLVLSSPDAKVWTEAYRLTVPGHDTRGPHFLAFDEKLFLFVGA
ncbi:MAG: hypothetical protein P1U87_04755 [Verrucomicrobiales bacterium]|nr:hypothetical protein [Verrucomicrobiales bacterium]